MNLEIVRKELNNLVDEYPITTKYIANTFGWDYTTLVKFKNGQEDYGEQKLNQLDQFITAYRKAMETLK